MSTIERRPTRDDIRRAQELEQFCQELVNELFHERRVEIPRLERHAIETLERPQERFVSEKRIARTVLNEDIPSREAWIDAVLLILGCGPDLLRARFALQPEGRNDMVRAVQVAGGLQDAHQQWRAL